MIDFSLTHGDNQLGVGLYGGMDSSTTAALIKRAFDRFTNELTNLGQEESLVPQADRAHGMSVSAKSSPLNSRGSPEYFARA
jgi:NH3-dependent NAD+ synthetase